MPKEARPFVNPLTQPTTPTQKKADALPETTTQTEVISPTQTPLQAPTLIPVQTEDDEPVVRRKRGKQAFANTHVRFSTYLLKRKKKRLEKLAKQVERSYVDLLDEAVDYLFEKYEEHER